MLGSICGILVLGVSRRMGGGSVGTVELDPLLSRSTQNLAVSWAVDRSDGDPCQVGYESDIKLRKVGGGPDGLLIRSGSEGTAAPRSAWSHQNAGFLHQPPLHGNRSILLSPDLWRTMPLSARSFPSTEDKGNGVSGFCAQIPSDDLCRIDRSQRWSGPYPMLLPRAVLHMPSFQRVFAVSDKTTTARIIARRLNCTGADGQGGLW